jgi:16S rRNA (uracil1498-N3)-methyltransferase
MGHAAGTAGRQPRDRFFVTPGAIGAEVIRLDAAQQHQIRRVLRLQAGDRIVVLDGTGDEWVATLQVSGDALYATPIERRPGLPVPGRCVWLYPSALRGDRFAWILQKGTEIGVAGFVPTHFARTLQADYAARTDRYLAIVREAAEQCGRSTLPVVLPPQRFVSLLPAQIDPGSTWLLLDESDHDHSLRVLVARQSATVHLFVGPEGGLTPVERAAAQAHGVVAASLGRNILRVETAAIVAATLALAASADLA